MGAAEYSRRRGQLLQACAWNGWASRKGYSPTAAGKRKENQAQLAALRQARRPLALELIAA